MIEVAPLDDPLGFAQLELRPQADSGVHPVHGLGLALLESDPECLRLPLEMVEVGTLGQVGLGPFPRTDAP